MGCVKLRGLSGLMVAGWVALGTALPGSDVELTITLKPEIPAPGKNAQVTLHFEKDPDFVEKRLVYVVEVRKAHDDSLVRAAAFDNGGAGYAQASGSVFFVQSMPTDADAVYFNAYACPWSMNQWIVDQFRSYPTNGTYTYSWVSNSFGVMNDVIYRGSAVAPKPGNNTT